MKFLRVLLFFFVSKLPISVFAQEELIEAEVDWFAELIRGGNTALVLVFLLMASIYFMVERILSLRKKYIVPKELVSAVKPLWQQGKHEQIVEYCKAHPSTLARMVNYITRYREADPGLLIPGAQDIASRELKTHAQKSFSLAVVAALAPLLGLLGTMVGMIESFKLVEVYGDEGGASMLAGSISKALITTAVGLIIAIPCLALYHWFKFRINALSESLEENLESLVNSWLLDGGVNLSVKKTAETSANIQKETLIEELKEDQLIIEKSLNIYLSKDQKQHGPFSMNQLKEHIADGAFDENDLSCHDGKNWVSVSETLKLGS